MSTKILSLAGFGYKEKNNNAITEYSINYEEDIVVSYPKNITYQSYIINGGNIIDPNNKPAYGFKLVRNKFKQYMYMRLNDNAVIPYIFDYATNFDKNGLAMVGKDGVVSWINKRFLYFSSRDVKMVELSEDETFDGWDYINAFSEGKIKLSRCQELGNYYTSTSYLESDGKPKTFYKYTSTGVDKQTIEDNFPDNFTEFNKDGYAFSPDKEIILSATGYYMDADELIKELVKTCPEQLVDLAIENGMLKEINKSVQKSSVFQKK